MGGETSVAAWADPCRMYKWHKIIISNRSRGLPVGQISGGGDFPVQSHFQKYFPPRLTQINSISPAVLSPRGAYRDRHGRGMGCGGRGQRGLTNGADADGEVVWS